VTENSADLCLAQISDSMVDMTLKKMNFCKYHLVVEPLQFSKKVVDEYKCSRILFGFELAESY
jgi:hypothetical protein